MKKLIVSALVCAMASFNAFADVDVESGNLSDLKNKEVRVLIEFDYSQCKIEDKDVDAFLKEKGQDWVESYPNEIASAESSFIAKFNKKSKYCKITSDEEIADYKLVFKITKFHYGSTGASVIFGGGFTKKAGGASVVGVIEVLKNGDSKSVALLKVDGLGDSSWSNEARRINAYVDVAEDLAKVIKKAEDND